jgi:hypothetical protein
MIRALLSATLTERLGIERAADQLVDLGDRPGATHQAASCSPGPRQSLAGLHRRRGAGRCGSTQAVLGYRVTAASTVGTLTSRLHLRPVRQLDPICSASASSAARTVSMTSSSRSGLRTEATHGLAAGHCRPPRTSSPRSRKRQASAAAAVSPGRRRPAWRGTR